MKIFINLNKNKIILGWLNDHPKIGQWAWFVGLWCAGLITVSVLTYPLKMLIRAMR